MGKTHHPTLLPLRDIGRLGTPQRSTLQSAGLDPSVIPWLKQRDIAIGSDHPLAVSPSSPPGAVHDFVLLYLGVHLCDNCDLKALADAAADRKRWDFLLTAAALQIRGGTGSPANPIATF
jgi:hypothetical protein